MNTSKTLFVVLLLTSIFSFVNIPTSNYHHEKEIAEPNSDEVPAYKVETATKVFNQLKRSLGIIRSEKPFFYLRKKLPNPRFRMAMIYYGKGAIYLEEAAYDLCTAFGKDSLNALAVYLGHELAHLTGKHNVTNHYAWDYEKSLKEDKLFKQLEKTLPESKKDSLLTIIKKRMRYFTSTENEKMADLEGGFLSYLSGYQTFGIAPQLLDKTYTDFRLPPNPKSYPSLEERKQIAVNSEKKLRDLIDLYEMGNLLIVLNEYDDAILYYNKVLKQFKSREIYNNIGVLYTLSFLEKANKQKVKYAFPVELDAISRLSKGSKGLKDNERQKLLFAIENFEKASSLDDDYPISHLNKSCVHALLGLHADDEDVAAEEYAIATAEVLIAKRLAKANPDQWKKTLTDTYTANGIIEALKGNKDEANRFFKEALELSPENHLAKINYDILNEIEKEPLLGFVPKGAAKKEIIDNAMIDTITINKKNIKDTVLKTKKSTIVFAVKNLDDSKLMTNHAKEGSRERYSSFHLADLDYKGKTTLGIKINDTLKDIKEKYNEPDTYVELGHGSWMIYEDAKIIFQIDADGKLVRWSIFNHKM